MADELESLDTIPMISDVVVEPKVEKQSAPVTITLRRKRPAEAAPVPVPVPVPVPAPQLEEAPAPAPADDKVLKEFFEKRTKKPELYGYDGTGGLVIRSKDGAVETTIPLPKYRPLTISEVADQESARSNAMDKAEENFEEAMDNLRQKIYEYVHGGSESAVKDAQLAVEVADESRMRAQFPNQRTARLESVRMNRLFPDEKGNTTVVPFDVYKRCVGMIPIREMYVKVLTDEEEAAKLAEEERQAAEGVAGELDVDVGIAPPAEPAPQSNILILFNRPDDNEYGFLSNEYPVEFNWKGVIYFMVDQALAAEKARYYGDMAILQKIMKTRSATTMRSEARKLGAIAPEAATEAEGAVQGQKAAQWTIMYPKVLLSVLLAKFRQHLGLRRQLLETGDAKIAFAEHRNTEEGIGLAISDTRAGIEAKWRGKNLLGQTLMDVRTQLRAGASEVTAAEAATVTDTTISAANAEAKQRGAIIGSVINRRNGGV